MDLIICKDDDLALQADDKADASMQLEAGQTYSQSRYWVWYLIATLVWLETWKRQVLKRSKGKNNLQNKFSTIIPDGTVLQDKFKVLHKVGSTSFAETYVVDRVHCVHCSNSDNDTTYEARFYKFGGLPPSVEAQRRRSIRRLSARTVLRTTWQGLHVVVYRTGALGNDPGPAHHKIQEKEGDILIGETPTSPGTFEGPKTKTKTTRQRESDRLRQQSRRKRNRQQKRQLQLASEDEKEFSDEKVGGEHQPKPRAHFEVDEDEFFLFEVLYFVNRGEAFRQELQHYVAPSTSSAVENYLAARDEEVALDDEDALADFITIKEREVVLLRRQYHKYVPVLREWFAQIKEIVHQQAIPSEFYEDSEHHNAQLPLMFRYEVLQSGLKALPDLIVEAEEMVDYLKAKLLNARQAWKKREGKLERKKLSKQVKNHQKFLHRVIPGTALYFDLLNDLESTEKRLESIGIKDQD